MQGQYKSTLHCPHCDQTSLTYDPFMMFSLPIPQNKQISEKFYFVPYD